MTDKPNKPDADKPKADEADAVKRDTAGRHTNTKMTKAGAAKLVYLRVPARDEHGKPKLNKDGEPMLRRAPVDAADVMSFAEYDDRVVVVTTAGVKISYDKQTKAVA